METQTETQPKKQSVLLVDYFIGGFNPLWRLLDRLGYNVKRVFNGREAVTYCRDNPDVDLVLIDFMGPDMDGVEAAQEIRKFNKELVIIAMGPVCAFNRKEVMEYGWYNDFIEKPFTFELFTSVLKKYDQL
jgi:CheY-like chemotaxis protein